MRSKTLSENDFLSLRSDAEVLEADDYGVKVLLLDDGRIMKLFRVRNKLSAAHIHPYSKRFIRNSRRLHKLGIATVSDCQHFSIPSQQRTAVIYQPLPGKTIRQLGFSGRLSIDHCQQVGEFLALLHRKGILFRSVHLGNIVRTDTAQLGLIDIADLSRHSWPLSRKERIRNFRHMFRAPEERDYLDRAQRAALLERYLTACPDSLARQASFRTAIAKHAKL